MGAGSPQGQGSCGVSLLVLGESSREAVLGNEKSGDVDGGTVGAVDVIGIFAGECKRLSSWRAALVVLLGARRGSPTDRDAWWGLQRWESMARLSGKIGIATS